MMRLTNRRKLAILSIWVQQRKLCRKEVDEQLVGGKYEDIQRMAKNRYRDGRLPWGMIGCCDPTHNCGELFCPDCWEERVIAKKKEMDRVLGKR